MSRILATGRLTGGREILLRMETDRQTHTHKGYFNNLREYTTHILNIESHFSTTIKV